MNLNSGPSARRRPVRDAVYWLEQPCPPLPPLTGATSADVVVVGGGMMGLICARILTAAGASVALVESRTCGAGASGRSSGFITPDSELEFRDLVRQFGRNDALRLWNFANGGVATIRTAIEQDGIDCDLRRQDGLYVAARHQHVSTVEGEHAARTAAGLESTLLSPPVLSRVLGGTAYAAGLRFAGTFGIDGYLCCIGLRRALLERGARVFEASPATHISANGVDTATGSIRAGHVVVCTDHGLPALGLATRSIFHVQTFLGISEPLATATVTRLFPSDPVMVWDSTLIYHYFRMVKGQRLLVGGGTLLSTYALHEQHRPENVARRLSRYLARHFPGNDVRFAATWPGFIGISKDFAPVIGHHPRAENVHFAGGAAGLPWAAALGRYLAEKVLHRRNEWDRLLAADRKFAVGPNVQALIGRPPAFALSHGLAKLSSG